MFDPFTLALMGGAVGGLLNKKDPLTGAVMGAGLGYGAGALGGAGGLLGTAAPNGAAYTGTAAELAADGLGGVAMTPTPFESAIGSVPGMVKQAKPYMDAVGTGMQVANQFQDKPVPITPSPIMPPTFNNAPGQMVASMQQQQAERIAIDQQRRMQRRQARGGLL